VVLSVLAYTPPGRKTTNNVCTGIHTSREEGHDFVCTGIHTSREEGHDFVCIGVQVDKDF
jgi:hypothetical protein